VTSGGENEASVTITSSPSHRHHHLLSITSSPSPPLHHFLSITSSPSLPIHHLLFINFSLSYPPHTSSPFYLLLISLFVESLVVVMLSDCQINCVIDVILHIYRVVVVFL
jgi:hypothetical protein